ncbi:MAG: fibronectin type III domain-containing protein, partial [Bacteroidales bacterium]
MKKTINAGLIVILSFSLFAWGCKKKDIPVLTTTAATEITTDAAKSGGEVTDDGNEDVSARGVCWNTTGSPTVTDPHTSDGKGTGSFTSSITGLTGGTVYYVRAYATNKEGTGYGLELTFKTQGSAPITSALDATNITVSSATLNGLVNPNYLSTTVTFEYGLTTSYGSTATATQSPVSGSTSTNVSAAITGLNPGATYHFRVKTVNSIGTVYSDDKTFLTLGQAPVATTGTPSNVTVSGASLSGTVNANLVSTTVTFEYGLTTAYGSSVNATPGTVTGNTVTDVTATLTSLNPGTLYHVRIKAVNAIGTSYGTDATFTTGGQAPSATTSAATNLNGITATVNGSVNANELSTVVTFEYGLTTGYGSTATATQSPVTGNVATAVSANLTSLAPATTYHFRVKAVNALGTTYGDDLTFTTLGAVP